MSRAPTSSCTRFCCARWSCSRVPGATSRSRPGSTSGSICTYRCRSRCWRRWPCTCSASSSTGSESAVRIKLVRVTRSRKGHAIRVEQTIEADAPTIGRGAQCVIHLPDPRVAYEHAIVVVQAGTHRITGLGGASLAIGGRGAADIALTPGSRFEIGPYQFGVEPPAAGCDLCSATSLRVRCRTRYRKSSPVRGSPSPRRSVQARAGMGRGRGRDHRVSAGAGDQRVHADASRSDGRAEDLA